jgi:hypothetical protein
MGSGQQGHPQFAAAVMASISAGAVISSMAMTWGFMARSSSIQAWALGHPSITSVFSPTSI